MIWLINKASFCKNSSTGVEYIDWNGWYNIRCSMAMEPMKIISVNSNSNQNTSTHKPKSNTVDFSNIIRANFQWLVEVNKIETKWALSISKLDAGMRKQMGKKSSGNIDSKKLTNVYVWLVVTVKWTVENIQLSALSIDEEKQK